MPAKVNGRRKSTLVLAAIAVASIGTLLLSEILIRIVSPQRTMVPRKAFSAEYGFVNFRDTRTIHSKGREWRFIYTTNEHGNRGTAIPISNTYEVPNIVVLGDSYTFGLGVNDGEEYPAIMAKRLENLYNVTSLSVAGWGLTQHIRRFYEFGLLYTPEVVVLQFCINDPGENLNHMVTRIDEGRFVFADSDSNVDWVKKYLSDSVIQRSHLYNLFRDSVYRYFMTRHARSAERSFAESMDATEKDVPVDQRFYNELLELFAQDLQQRGVWFLMIAVNNELDKAPYIKEKVRELDASGVLDYVEVTELFVDVTDFESPEGHLWGRKAHRLIGERLSDLIVHSNRVPRSHETALHQ